MIRQPSPLRRNTRSVVARPEKADPLSAYTERMSRALNHIDAHLDTPPEIAQLAALAQFSPFHFHRIFTAWMGETLSAYRRRRQLEMAAIRLADERQTPVLHIALALGFESSTDFTHAFKARFNCTPGAWRAQTNEGEARLYPRRQSALDLAIAPTEASDLRISLAERPATRVAYLRYIGPYGPSVARFWQETFLPWMHANNLGNRDCYGIGHNDPHIGDPTQFRYDACVEVPESFIPNGQAGLATLPGGRYAQARYCGDASGIARAWQRLLGEWLPQSGLQIDNRPCFAHLPFDGDCAPLSDEFDCHLCIPVKPL